MIKIDFDQGLLKDAAIMFADAPKEVGRAAAAAINRTLRTVRKQVSVTVRERYVVPADTIKKTISLHKASQNVARGSLLSKGTSLGLNKFRVTQPKKGPMRAKVQKQGRPKPVKGLFPLKKYYMQRKRSASYPLRSPMGPSVPQMLGNNAVLEILAPLAEETLNNRFLHEITYRYRKRDK